MQKWRALQISGRNISADVAGEYKVVVLNLEKDFPGMIENYRNDDNHNLDETGLYFKSTNTKIFCSWVKKLSSVYDVVTLIEAILRASSLNF